MAIGTNSYANRNSVAYGVAAKANDGYSVAIGANAVTNRVGSNEVGVSSDRGMIAIGSNSVAKLEGATAIGSKAEAAGQQSTAVGNGAQAKGYNSSAFGEGAIAEKNYGVAVGKSANAKEQLGIAVGKNASAENYLSTAVGAKTQAKGESSIAIGSGDLDGGTDLDAPEGAKATGNASMAVGASAKATADNATALGKKATASGRDSIAAGATANASGTDSIATGHNANATGANAVATGANASAAGNAAAYGDNSKATGGWSSAFGNESKATATDASAFGNSANVSTQNGTAIGSHSTVTAINGTALGNQANVTIPGGVALGQGSSSSRTALNKNKVKITAGHVEDSEGISQNDDNNKNGDVYAPVKLIDKAEVLERVKNTIFGSAGAVSLGKDGETTRQLTNLAPGSKDSDAVNVAQLKAVVGSIVKYDVTSPDKSITIEPTSETDKYGNRKTTFNVKMNTTAVQNAAAWNLKEGSKNDNGEQVRGGDTVSFTDTETINVTRNGKQLTFNANTSSMSADGNNLGKIWTNDSNTRYLAKTKNVVDAINASGWILQANGKNVGLVNPGDKVNIATDANSGITITPTNENTNGVSTIKLKANVTNVVSANSNATITRDPNTGIVTVNAKDTNTQASVSKLNNDSPITIDSDGTNSAGAKDYKLDVNVDGTTITKTGGVLKAVIPAVEKVDLTVNKTGNNAGKVEAPKDADKGKLVTAENVVKAVNESYWVAKKGDRVETNADTTSDDSNVTAGSNVTFVAGKNIALQKDGNKFIYATKDNVTFTDVTTNNFTVNANGNVNMGGNQIHNVKAGTAETDAVNVKQLKSTERHITPNTYTYNDTDKSVTLTYTDGNGNLVKDTKAKIDLSGLASKIKDYSFKTNATGSNLVGTGADTTVASGKSVNFAASDNLTLKQDVNNGNVTYTYGLKNQVVVGEKGTPGADGKPGKDGVDGSIGVNGKDGSAVAINGKDGSIGLNGKDGKNGLTIKGDKGAFGVDGTNGKDGKDGMTRIVYTDNNNVKHEVATLDDGQKYAGDNYVAAKDNQAESNVIAKKANERLDIVGGAKGNLTEGNIGVNAKDGKLHVQLAEKVNLGDKGAVTIGDTVVNNNGITINSPADLNGVTNKTVSLTNQGLNNGGNKITNVAEGENDTDAVNVKQLKDFKSEVAEGGLTFAGNSGDAHKAKLNSTVNIKGGEGNTDADQFDNGKNVMTKVNGNTVTVSIKKTPEVEGINIIDTTGKVKVKLTQTDEGLKVSDGNNNATRITNVKAGEKDTDAVNVKQLNAAKTEVTAGDNIDVRSSTGANGQTIYKVSANDTSAAVEAGSDHVKVTKAANTHKDGSTTVTDYTVDLSDKTTGDIGKGVKAYDKVTNEGLTFNADKGSTGVKKLGSKVSVNGDGKNITTTADENGVKVSMKDDIKVNSVTAKEVKVGDVNINENGINAGGKRITNVAPGKDGTDAVNVNQLKYVAGNISNQINNVDKGLRAGIAGALASGGLYHVTTAGKSMVSVGAGTYRGQNALAVGYSRLSDNGKVGVKFTVNSNSQGHAGASASVGYQW